MYEDLYGMSDVRNVWKGMSGCKKCITKEKRLLNIESMRSTGCNIDQSLNFESDGCIGCIK